MRKTGLLLALFATALTACGGGDSVDDAFQGTGGGAGGGGGGTGAPGATNVQLGTGTGSSFQPGAIAISTANLSAGGSTSLGVTLVSNDGTLSTQDATVTFNSPCIAAGTAAITPSAPVLTQSGSVTVTYVAKGCSGTDTVSATASTSAGTRTASGVVTVAAAAVGSIAFVSATPNNIALKGTGDAGRPESSTVIFRVLDASGGPRAGAQVGFSLNTSVGGITLQPASATATSDAQGNVQVVINAGTVATSVKVTATVANTAIATQSSQLTITTGIPTAGSFSLSAQCFNVEGLDYDGTTTGITARLADRFLNPAPDGSAVTFTTEGGAITAQCTTTTTEAEGGVCSVNWRSSNPRPANGRVTILAKAIGEESFADANGNGAFDAGEIFTDLPEPFRDDNEDGAYTAGVDGDFFDFNNNGVRDGADTRFNGVLCNDASRCGPASTRSTGIGQQIRVIMSGSAALMSAINGSPHSTVVIPQGASTTVAVYIRDVNGNPMPGGSDVTATMSGAGATLGTPSAFKVACSAAPADTRVSGATVFAFNVSAGTAAGSSVLTVSVKTPKGVETYYPIGISVP